jgi:RHS repeat-associated protein
MPGRRLFEDDRRLLPKSYRDRLQLTGLNAGNALALNIYPCDQGLTACSSGNIGATWRETITTNGALNAIQEFRHDSLNRLLTASEKTAPFTNGPTCPDSTSVWCRQFNFDVPGNRTIAGRSPSGSEARDVSSISPTTNKILDAGWSYDAAGNVISANNAQTSVSLLYDAENRQVASCYPYSASCTNTPGAGVTVYYYDGEGRRVEQVDPVTGTTIFVYDAFGNLAADYATLPAPPTSSTEYVTVDDVGTTRLVTDTQGNVLERHDFEPFGHELMGTEGGWRSPALGYGVTPTSVRQQFTGQERDDTGLDFFQARYFTSAQGRFASVDPGNAGANLFDPQSWNGYAYVSNSPLRFTDPSGMDDGGGIPIIGAIIDFFSTLFGGGSSAPPTLPGPSTGTLDAQNPTLQGFNPCGGPSGTFGGGATGCPFVFSATNNGGSPVWVSGDLVPTDFGTVWNGLKYIYTQLNPPPKTYTFHINGKVVTGPVYEGVIPFGPPSGTIWTSTGKLSSVWNAFQHWLDHGAEFPDLENSLQYVKQAWEFVTHPPKGTLSKIRLNGDVLLYDPATNTFAVKNAAGMPRTMFKPTLGATYFNAQH